MRPEVARNALLATHGGLSLELCAVIGHISPMALYRLICALGHQSLVAVLTRGGLPPPAYILADEKHSRCLTERGYLPTIVRGRVLWHLGYSASKSAAALTKSYGVVQCAALEHEPSYQLRGALTDGFDSGCVANFAQVVVKGELPLSVERLGGQGVELIGRSEPLVSGLKYHLFFLDHVHEFDSNQSVLGCLKRFEP